VNLNLSRIVTDTSSSSTETMKNIHLLAKETATCHREKRRTHQRPSGSAPAEAEPRPLPEIDRA